MNYIGIVGTLSPLGQTVVAALQAKSAEYKIIFMVDSYPAVSVAEVQFQNLEQVLTHNLQPTLVLDLSEDEKSFERAKFYRKNGFPAIMLTTFSEEQTEVLQCLSRGVNRMPTPLVAVDDFAMAKNRMLANVKLQVKNLSCEVNRIYVNVRHNLNEERFKRYWLAWATSVNAMLGEYTDKPQRKGNATTLGFVRITSDVAADTDEQEENIDISLQTSDDTVLKWACKGNLLASRTSGVMAMLKWYFKNIRHDVDLASGEVISDVRPE